jgi:predicted glutamine amidotransferase
MCRWAAYRGQPRFLEDSEAKTATNGDGFGIAWYGERAEPGLYRDILPAWSDCNLKSLARQIRSPLFLAHVRASTTGATRRDNCHPFVSGRWSFMHNGQIGPYMRVKRALEAMLNDRCYGERVGTTDSELLFLLARHCGLDDDPEKAMRSALTLAHDACLAAGVAPDIRFTAAFSNGRALYAVRYASDDCAPTLYTAQAPGGYFVVSEPLDDDGATWAAVPQASFLVLDDDGLTVRPFTLETASGLRKAG